MQTDNKKKEQMGNLKMGRKENQGRKGKRKKKKNEKRRDNIINKGTWGIKQKGEQKKESKYAKGTKPKIYDNKFKIATWNMGGEINRRIQKNRGKGRNRDLDERQ